MAFAFKLPTTSSLALSACFSSPSHPSLIQSASTHRQVVRNVLKKHKRLAVQAQASNLVSVKDALEVYVPYLLAICAGLANRSVGGEAVHVKLLKGAEVEWRSTLSCASAAGREPARLRRKGIDYERLFVLTALAETHCLLARAKIYEILYAPSTPTSSSSTPSIEQRNELLQAATRDLLKASSIHTTLATSAHETDASSAVIETLSQTQTSLASLCLAEATLLAVMKDDPYPFLIIQSRNSNDREWMVRPPEIPKVRAHLFARLCLAAAEHAAKAEAGLCATGRLDEALMGYVVNLKTTARARACRMLAIDAECAGETGKALAWLGAAAIVLGNKGSLNGGSDKGGEGALTGLRKLKRDWTERREDKRIERGADWGSDAGKTAESRVVEYLHGKWTKVNDTINTQIVPPSDPLLANLPSGREVHSPKPYIMPTLSKSTLDQLRSPVDRTTSADIGFSDADSSGDEYNAADPASVPGGFPADTGGGSSRPVF